MKRHARNTPKLKNMGQLIVLEGPDNVGKSTLSRALFEHMTVGGHKCELMSFPGHEPATLGRHIYDLHHSPGDYGIEAMSPTSVQLLHIAAHVDAIETRILPALRQGRSIILDRFWWSAWVYGVAAGITRDEMDEIVALEQRYWNQALPTAVFLISRPCIGPRDAAKHSQHLANLYLELASRERARYPVINTKNEASISETLGSILAELHRARLASADMGSVTPGESVARGRRDNKSTDIPREKQALLGGLAEPPNETPHVWVRLEPARPSEVYDTYWRFAAERQEVFFRRAARLAPPWTADPILQEYKFTNAFRAADRASQYLIKRVVYEGDKSPDEALFRMLLFKVFNRIGTWQLLRKEIGELRYKDYDFGLYDAVLTKAREERHKIYSAAYIMPTAPVGPGYRVKHRNHLTLVQMIVDDDIAARLADTSTMRAGFELLRAYPTIGDFLAYQFVTDINYGEFTDWSEMEFVMPGPGARDGIRKCFSTLGGLSEMDIIRMMTDSQEGEFERLGLGFRDLWGRRLQLIDCQNLFCEVDKYARLAHPNVKGRTGRTRIKQKFRPNPEPVDYWFPPKWGINQRVESFDGGWQRDVDDAWGTSPPSGVTDRNGGKT